MRLSPYVILNDFGGAFSMGVIGGGIWHGIKGARNSPKVGHRYPSMFHTVDRRSPATLHSWDMRGPLNTDLTCRENE